MIIVRLPVDEWLAFWETLEMIPEFIPVSSLKLLLPLQSNPSEEQQQVLAQLQNIQTNLKEKIQTIKFQQARATTQTFNLQWTDRVKAINTIILQTTATVLNELSQLRETLQSLANAI
jgi:hypothetical protein